MEDGCASYDPQERKAISVNLALLSETHKHMQQKGFKKKGSQLGLEINVGKTNAIKSIPDPPNPSHLKVVLLRKYKTSSTSGATSVQIVELTNMWN